MTSWGTRRSRGPSRPSRWRPGSTSRTGSCSSSCSRRTPSAMPRSMPAAWRASTRCSRCSCWPRSSGCPSARTRAAWGCASWWSTWRRSTSCASVAPWTAASWNGWTICTSTSVSPHGCPARDTDASAAGLHRAVARLRGALPVSRRVVLGGGRDPLRGRGSWPRRRPSVGLVAGYPSGWLRERSSGGKDGQERQPRVIRRSISLAGYQAPPTRVPSRMTIVPPTMVATG